MLIDHTQTLRSLYSERWDYSRHVQSVNPQKIACSALPFELTLTFVYDAKVFRLEWKGADKPLEVGEVTIRVSSVKGKELWLLRLPPGPFPPCPSGVFVSGVVGASYSDARIEITAHKAGESCWSATELAARIAALTLSRQPNDVCFVFPRTKRRLWANEAVLRQAPPYFQELFSSDCAESKPRAPPADFGSTVDLDPYTYDDSDAETDDILEEKNPAYREKNGDEDDKTPCKVIDVTDTAYSTYFAVLVWITTGSIAFAPLRSASSSSSSCLLTPDSSPTSSRRKAIDTHLASHNPLLPPPVSPKSAYRLAHLLSLPSLQSLALSSLKSQLSASNAAQELFGDVSCAYAEVRELAMQKVVEGWQEVKDSEGMKQAEKRAKEGEAGSEQAVIALEMARRLMERHGK
ncbi:hypothetical protein JCM8097_003343 [Rhodosporidiobolus ruineniae]